MKKKIIISSTLLFLFIIAAGIFYFYNGQTSYEGQIPVSVHSSVTIDRDSSGIPFIKAETKNDAYFAMGFLHAQDRLILIEYYRAIALGRFSELIGKEGLPLDKLMRTMGFAVRADEIISELDAQFKDYLKCYVRGINDEKEYSSARLSSMSGLSGSEWKERDVISILLLLEWSNAFLNNREMLFPLPEDISKDLQEIIPDDLIYTYSEKEKNIIDHLLKIKKLLKNRTGSFLEGFAFFINGKNLHDATAIAGFNLDSATGVYPVWYPVSLEIGGQKIDGISACGMPFIFYGKNNAFSFSSFNLKVDTQDFCLEKVKKSNEGILCFRKGRWRPFDERAEIIHSGADGIVNFAVRTTDAGPVIGDIFGDQGNTHCFSLRSLFPDKGYLSSLFSIPFAESIDKARMLLRNVKSLPRIYLFASGDKAMKVYSGLIPVRNTSEFFQKTKVKYLNIYWAQVSADKNVITGDISAGEHSLTAKYALPADTNRFIRLKNLLERDKPFKTTNMADILNDVHSLVAEKYIPAFLPVLEQIPVTSAELCRIYFNNWGFNMNMDSVSPVIFHALLVNMIKETFADELGSSLDIVMENYSLIIDKYYRLFVDGSSSLFDDINTRDKIEDRDSVFGRTFIKTMRRLHNMYGPIMSEWKWGTVHRGSFNIPHQTSFLEKQFAAPDDAGISGGTFTVRKGSVNASSLSGIDKISCVAGFSHTDKHLFFIRSDISNSIVQGSKFFSTTLKNNKLKLMTDKSRIHRLTLIPSGN